jgi:hypothetical protein
MQCPSQNKETFEEFYARISANRKAAIAAETDPAKLAELKAWDAHFEASYKAAWQMAEATKSHFISAVSEAERLERAAEYPPKSATELSYSAEHSTYRVIDGEAA